jgi:hypothetical protein
MQVEVMTDVHLDVSVAHRVNFQQRVQKLASLAQQALNHQLALRIVTNAQWEHFKI